MCDGAVIESKKRIRILDVPVDRVSRAEAIEVFEALMRTEGCSLIVTPNSEIVWNASKDAALKSVVSGADLIIPDGVGLVYASRILGSPLSERVTGIDFLDAVLQRLSDTGESVYLLGGAPGGAEMAGGSDGAEMAGGSDVSPGGGAEKAGGSGDRVPCVAEKAAENMRKKYPKLRVAGFRHGYYAPEEEAAIVDEINASGAAFLCAALGSPKQERFIHAHKDALRVRAAIGVGGSLDVWAGVQRRAPAFFRNHGLEWLYRLVRQPSRIKRAAALPLFMLRVLAGHKAAGQR